MKMIKLALKSTVYALLYLQKNSFLSENSSLIEPFYRYTNIRNQRVGQQINLSEKIIILMVCKPSVPCPSTLIGMT